MVYFKDILNPEKVLAKKPKNHGVVYVELMKKKLNFIESYCIFQCSSTGADAEGGVVVDPSPPLCPTPL